MGSDELPRPGRPAASHMTSSPEAVLARVVREARAGEDTRRRLWIALSGGADSMALLWMALRLRTRGNPDFSELGVVHVDHGQHRQSAETAAAIRKIGPRFALATRIAVLNLAPGCSEAELRDARFAAFVAELGGGEADPNTLLLTAHHREDQLETIVFRARRGAGRRGLAGMPAIRPRGPTGGPLLVRPLLEITPAKLHEALESAPEDLEPHEDPTNRDLRFARNRIRHQVLPELRRRHASRGGRGSFDDRLLRIAAAARSRADRAERAGRELLAAGLRSAVPWRAELQLHANAKPTDRPSRVSSEALAAAARQVHIQLLGRSPLESWLRRVEALAESPRRGDRVRSSGALLVERTPAGGLLFVDEEHCGAPPTIALPLPKTGMPLRFGSTEWWITVHPPGQPLPPPAASHGFTTPLPHGAASLRAPRPGDRLIGRERPLSRTLGRSGIARFDRTRLPVLVDSEDAVLWCPGLRSCAPAPDSEPDRPGAERRVLQITVGPPGGIERRPSAY